MTKNQQRSKNLVPLPEITETLVSRCSSRISSDDEQGPNTKETPKNGQKIDYLKLPILVWPKEDNIFKEKGFRGLKTEPIIGTRGVSESAFQEELKALKDDLKLLGTYTSPPATSELKKTSDVYQEELRGLKENMKQVVFESRDIILEARIRDEEEKKLANEEKKAARKAAKLAEKNETNANFSKATTNKKTNSRRVKDNENTEILQAKDRERRESDASLLSVSSSIRDDNSDIRTVNAFESTAKNPKMQRKNYFGSKTSGSEAEHSKLNDVGRPVKRNGLVNLRPISEEGGNTGNYSPTASVRSDNGHCNCQSDKNKESDNECISQNDYGLILSDLNAEDQAGTCFPSLYSKHHNCSQCSTKKDIIESINDGLGGEKQTSSNGQNQEHYLQNVILKSNNPTHRRYLISKDTAESINEVIETVPFFNEQVDLNAIYLTNVDSMWIDAKNRQDEIIDDNFSDKSKSTNHWTDKEKETGSTKKMDQHDQNLHEDCSQNISLERNDTTKNRYLDKEDHKKSLNDSNVESKEHEQNINEQNSQEQIDNDETSLSELRNNSSNFSKNETLSITPEIALENQQKLNNNTDEVQGITNEEIDFIQSQRIRRENHRDLFDTRLNDLESVSSKVTSRRSSSVGIPGNKVKDKKFYLDRYRVPKQPMEVALQLHKLGFEFESHRVRDLVAAIQTCESNLKKAIAQEKKEVIEERKRAEREARERERQAALKRRKEEQEEREKRRREREAIERQVRQQAAIERRKYNLELMRNINNTILQSKASRSYKFSYFTYLPKPKRYSASPSSSESDISSSDEEKGTSNQLLSRKSINSVRTRSSCHTPKRNFTPRR